MHPPHSRIRILMTVGLWWGAMAASAAGAGETDFIGQLTAAERDALGIETMSEAQRTALESAVRRYVEGRNDDAVATATAEVRQQLDAELSEREVRIEQTEEELARARAALAAQAVPAESKPSLLDRARVMLTPGTRIEYSTLDSKLAGPFVGWRKGTRFRLENGQVWRVVSGEYVTPPEEAGKALRVVPGAMGSFFIEFEGVRSSPRVELME